MPSPFTGGPAKIYYSEPLHPEKPWTQAVLPGTYGQFDRVVLHDHHIYAYAERAKAVCYASEANISSWSCSPLLNPVENYLGEVKYNNNDNLIYYRAINFSVGKNEIYASQDPVSLKSLRQLSNEPEDRDQSNQNIWLYFKKDKIFSYGKLVTNCPACSYVPSINYSLDGGINWNRSNIEKSDDSEIRAMASRGDTIVAVSFYGYIYASLDGGMTFKIVKRPYSRTTARR